MINNIKTINLKNPLVSIVAYCYNQENYLEETLNSILKQTYQNIQLVIMDDYSTDNSVEKIKIWIKKNNVDCTFIPHKYNKGICKTVNEALNYVKGEYYQAIACDDTLLPEMTETIIKVFNKCSPNTAVVYSNMNLITSNGIFIKHAYNIEFDPTNYNYLHKLIEANFITAPSCIIKKKCLDIIGKYDENIKYEDYDMWLRLSTKYNFEYCSKTLVNYRISENQTSNMIRKNGLEYYTNLVCISKHYGLIDENIDKLIICKVNNYTNLLLKSNSAYSLDGLKINYKIFPEKRLKFKIYWLSILNKPKYLNFFLLYMHKILYFRIRQRIFE